MAVQWKTTCNKHRSRLDPRSEVVVTSSQRKKYENDGRKFNDPTLYQQRASVGNAHFSRPMPNSAVFPEFQIQKNIKGIAPIFSKKIEEKFTQHVG
jgi:hypothetical protein